MVDVMYFAWVRERVGEPREQIDTKAATVTELVDELRASRDAKAAEGVRALRDEVRRARQAAADADLARVRSDRAQAEAAAQGIAAKAVTPFLLDRLFALTEAHKSKYLREKFPVTDSICLRLRANRQQCDAMKAAFALFNIPTNPVMVLPCNAMAAVRAWKLVVIILITLHPPKALMINPMAERNPTKAAVSAVV